MPSVIQVNKLDISKVGFTEPKKCGKSMCSFINYTQNGKQDRLMIQFPKLFAPFGASSFADSSKELPSYNVMLSLDPKVPGASQLKNFLDELDKKVCKKAAKNKKWFSLLKKANKKLTPDTVGMFHTASLKQPSDEKYPHSFNMKVPINWTTKQPGVSLFNKNKESIEVTFESLPKVLPKYSEIKGLFQVSHVWFVNGKFGVALKFIQGLVYPKEDFSGYNIVDSDNEEEEEDNNSDNEEEEEEDNVVADDDDEDEVSVDEESED